MFIRSTALLWRTEPWQDGAMTQYPWWGVPLVTGVFALAGVFLAQFVTMRINNQKVSRDIDMQWNSEKRRIYSEFLAECSQALLILTASRRRDRKNLPQIIDPLKLSLLVYEMQLIASRQLSIHATKLSQETQLLIEAAKSPEPVDDETYTALRQAAINASTRFIECARRELATSGK